MGGAASSVLVVLAPALTELKSILSVGYRLSYGQGTCEVKEYRRLEVIAVEELRESLTFPREIKQAELKGPVASRSARLLYYL